MRANRIYYEGRMCMKKENIFIKTADMFDIPADTKGGLLHIELSGNREAFFENHKGIISLGEEEIEINSPSGSVCVVGGNLRVTAMNAAELRICGRIERIEYKGQGI